MERAKTFYQDIFAGGKGAIHSSIYMKSANFNKLYLQEFLKLRK